MRRRLTGWLMASKAANITLLIGLFVAVNYVIPYVYEVYPNDVYVGLHLLLEFLSIVVAFAIGSLVWLIREGLEDYSGRFILIAGLTISAVGFVDIMHALSFGLPSFITANSGHKAIVLWLYGRYLLITGVLAAVLWPRRAAAAPRKMANVLVVVLGALVLGAFVLATAYVDAVPAMFTEESGLTPLKISLEHALNGLNGLALLLIWLKRREIRESVFSQMLYFLVFSIFSELSFTFYTEGSDTYNLVGHFYKIAAYYFLYKAVYLAGIVNYFYTLSEMGKMSADLLKEKISLDGVLAVQMAKLKKLVPQAEQIMMHLTAGPRRFQTVYRWGRFSELFPVGDELSVNERMAGLGDRIRLLPDPDKLLDKDGADGCDPPFSVIIKAAYQMMYLPLVSQGELHGFISLFTFNPANYFTFEDGEKAGVFQQYAALAVRQAKNQETINRLSYEDSLTGLPNRRFFFDELGKIRYDADQYGIPFTVVFIDMNDLKYLNDHFGHEAGDAALRLIARTMREAARHSDVPARIGGDEFGILLRHLPLDEAGAKVDAIRGLFAALALPEYSHTFSAAVGAACYPGEADDEDGLLRLADDRMYEHKRRIKAARVGQE